MGYRGQFLIELMIAMAILSIAMVAMVALNVRGVRLFKTARMETLLQGNASDLARGMINGIPGGSHGLLGAKSIQTGEDVNIIFTDKNDQTIQYYLTANTIYKTIDGGSDTRFFDFNDQVNIGSIDLRYYNKSDTQLATPVANPSEVTKIKIIATVKGKNENDPEVTLTTSVKPRNLFDL